MSFANAASAALSSQKSKASKTRFPRQIKYIVGNEACERFSFYGMRSILVIFMTQHLLMTEPHAKGVFHLFVSANYFLTLLGAYLSDRYLGKYYTIIYLSIVYCLGHGVLSVWESPYGLYLGLALIALGSGGIKPCVSAHVGDQFSEKNSLLLPKVFDVFYWSINFGSFFSTLLIPEILPHYGAKWAFGIPGVLMGIATLVFWMGRKEYVIVPPTGKTGQKGFAPVFFYSLLHFRERKEGEEFFDVARAKFSRAEIEGAKAAAAIFKVFITVAVFWTLWDQQGSSWVLQAEKMNRTVFGFTIEASQLQALNPIMVMLMIPFFSLVLYPFVERLGIKVTPLRKMATGMVFAGLSFACMGFLQTLVDGGSSISVMWQTIPYLIITASEVLVSITGLEFAYTQAPRSMKSTIMSFWLLTVAVGNMLTATVSELNRFHGSMEFYFYAALMGLVALLFIAAAARYQVRNYIECDEAGGLVPSPAV